jgi:hypothetical protein
MEGWLHVPDKRWRDGTTEQTTLDCHWLSVQSWQGTNVIYSSDYNVPPLFRNLQTRTLTCRLCGTVHTHYPRWSTVRLSLLQPDNHPSRGHPLSKTWQHAGQLCVLSLGNLHNTKTLLRYAAWRSLHHTICFIYLNMIHLSNYHSEEGPGGSMSWVVGLPNNSYKPITNTSWVRARLCILQPEVIMFNSCLAMVGGSLRVFHHWKIFAWCWVVGS